MTINLSDLQPNQCAYIIGDPKNQKCCGEATKEGIPYCEEHMRICYLPKTKVAPMEVRTFILPKLGYNGS